jgi:predicted SPOUT superfamily RNA methylase MTH1
MIGKKTLRKKDDDSEDSSSSENSSNKKNNLNKEEKKNINDKSKQNKKGLNIRELKAHIKNKNNNNDNNNDKNENNKPKYTKLEDSDSESDSESNSESESDSKSSSTKKKSEKKNENNKNKEKKESPQKSNKKIKKEKENPEFTKSTKINYTLSVLIPSSIVDNAQSKELRTYLIGEIARTLGIFKVSEVIIFHDKLKDNSKDYINYFIKNLQYLETPQYLRKTLFPMSEDLKLSGLMNPLESQHHLRKDEWSPYREGCVLERPVNGEYSWVNIGLNKDCKINQKLPPRTRVTVKLNETHFDPKLKYYTGTVVSMSEPFIKNGTYWGYVVRVCETYNDIFNNSIYKEGYDFIIGTSDKGENYRNANYEKKKDFKHCLIIFGGISGIEGMMIDDEHNQINSKDNVGKNFDLYLNTCMNQGLRTIRTEEAILISLAVIRPELDKIKGINY